MSRLKLMLGLMLVLGLSVAMTPAGEGIEFAQGTLDQAKAESKESGKLIFIDAYTSWCGPCKLMARNTFTDESVGAYFNENYINMKIDMERGEGPKVAQKYGVTAYPTLLIVDSQGNLVGRTLGYQNPEQLIAFGKKYATE